VIEDANMSSCASAATRKSAGLFDVIFIINGVIRIEKPLVERRLAPFLVSLAA